MPRLRRTSSRLRSVAAILLAVCTHGMVVVSLLASGVFAELPLGRPLPVLAEAGAVATEESVRPIEIEQFVEQLARPDTPTEEERKRKKEEEATKAEGQVVDIAKPAIEQRPDQARFLAEYDSTVQRETRGPSGRERAGARVEVPPVPPVPPAEAGTKGASPLAMRVPGGPPALDGPLLSELGPDGSVPQGQRRATPDRGGERRQDPGRASSPAEKAPNLIASPDQLSRALGGGSLDYLKDLDEGEFTALSAKKWKFASFFNRVKRAVADEWHPDTVYLRHDPSGNIYGVKDRVTVLRVHLSPDGKLSGAEIISPSGVDFLDDEAMSAFRRAQPFPNPPAQLIEGDGLIHFNFAFIFELSGKRSLKYFKY